ncbi:hypothetical protein AAFF_G00280340 [Aldrovandia affinis]|uniref:protein-tyrosine-phosphatase n=1 Tax=Aldrovandia affinis TaxID=143900 RepID=A0AAD7W1Q3_9TELE|nr:hypothetical protein AAFF_G00280340 [Aldrovandia affinis]
MNKVDDNLLVAASFKKCLNHIASQLSESCSLLASQRRPPCPDVSSGTGLGTASTRPRMDYQAQVLKGLLAQVTSKEEESEEAEGGIAGEFSRLKRQSTKYRMDKTYPTKVADRQENVKKNRYKDIVPFDHTRVKLSLITSETDTDYINASFIKGVFEQRAYIATQGPLPHTVQDFWRMIWEYNVEIIVMACREFEMGRKKCERYWPEKREEPFVCDPFIVQWDSSESKGDYLSRVLTVTYHNSSRTLRQLHYVNWPDHGVPDTIPPILELLQEMRSYQEHEDVPICIHCSAGCGRTGVLCAIDYTWKLLRNQMIPEDFSIFDLVQDMRTQRPSVVQTKEQYELVYRAIQSLFGNYLQMMAAHPSTAEVPACPSPSPVSSESDLTASCDLSDPEPEEEVKPVPRPRHIRREEPKKLASQAVAAPCSPALICPLAQEDEDDLVSRPPKRTPGDMLDSLRDSPVQRRHGDRDAGPERHGAQDSHSPKKHAVAPPTQEEDTPTQEEAPPAQRPNGEAQGCLRGEGEGVASPKPEKHLDSLVFRDSLCSMVEDPYSGPGSPEASPATLGSEEQPPDDACFAGPRLCLNGLSLALARCETPRTDLAPPSSDDDSPPPLPQRTPESYVLANSLVSSSGGERLAIVIPANMAEALGGIGSPPSPVPSLPERTPESFILDTEDTDLKPVVAQHRPLSCSYNVGTSSEWCGNTESLPLEPKKSRSKSLRVRMSMLVSPSVSLAAVSVHSEPTATHLPPPPPPPPSAEKETSTCITPPLPERTPESFILVTDEAPGDPNSASHHQPTRELSQRVGTSSEWAGNSQPQKFLDIMMNRSKSVRAKGSKNERLSVAYPVAPDNLAIAPGGSAPVLSVDSETAASAGAASETPDKSSGKSSEPGMTRKKSLRFLKNFRKPKGPPPPAAAPSGPPTYSYTPVFKLGFGTRFGKPKGPRHHPETWV